MALFSSSYRHRHAIKQRQVLAHLPGWTQASYSRLESGELAPAFDQVLPIAAALHCAGVEWTPMDRQQLLTLARERIETKKTYQEHKSEQQWDELRLELGRLDAQAVPQEHAPSPVGRVASRPRLLETRHLVGREEWLASVIASLQETLPKKLVVLQGPVGIGKSSELHRLALHFLQTDAPRPQVLLCELPLVEQEAGPESALDVVLATLLTEVGPSDSAILTASLDARMALVLTCLEKTSRALLLLIDNAEHLLDEQGRLAPCWQQFLGSFLRSRHRASLVLATKEWPSWCEGEQAFVAEYTVPALSVEVGAQLLQRLGLASLSLTHLRTASQAVGGVPLCLEWVALLVQEPLLQDDWQGILEDPQEPSMQDESQQVGVLAQRLLHLLEDPSLFGGRVAAKLTPLLTRIMHHRLSAEAIQVLHVLSLANVALGKPAVQRVCSHPRLLKELRDASLLMAYTHRVQLLPMVAALVRARLSLAQQQQGEEHLIDALTIWLNEGKASDREMGAMIAELAALYLKQHHLLDAAQLLIRYGWISFNHGYAPRLARRATEVLESFDWHTTEENEYGGLLLYNYLTPYLGKTIDAGKRFVDYQRIRDANLAGRVALRPSMEVFITHTLMVYSISEKRFEEAQAFVDACYKRLELLLSSNLDLHASLLEKRGWLTGAWCEFALEQGMVQRARELRERTLALYRQVVTLLSNSNEASPLESSFLKKRLARALNNLGYQLNRVGQYEEALQAIEQSIVLKEQGYVEFDTLAAAYGEKSQILLGLGRFQEALVFDEKAVTVVQKCIEAGYTYSQQEMWVYLVNRGYLYLRLGKVDDAEQLLQKALPHIQPRRREYRMFAREALDEIEQWRRQATSPEYQLDWRWVKRYRELGAFDAYWWWAQAGPFTEQEQQQWDQSFTPKLDEAAKEQLGVLLAQSRERELAAALAQQREPRLHYPALDIKEVRCRIAAMTQLATEIGQEEPNAIVRRLYQAAIEEETTFLRLFEATYTGESEHFQQLNLCLDFIPTLDEMSYALSQVRHIVLQGLRRSETRAASQRVLQFMQERLQFSFDPSSDEVADQQLQPETSLAPSQPQRRITAQAAKRFFETALRECGYEGWQVTLDPKANNAYVEGALRQMFLPDHQASVTQVRTIFTHEIAGHVARALAGELSPFGLLAVGTKGYLTTEEGIATYHERQVTRLHGEPFDESIVWYGTLAVGLASGVLTPAQTFLSLFSFFEAFTLLFRLLKRPDEDMQIAQKQAQRVALHQCLRTYRGVPDLEKAGVCFGKDVSYLRGIQMIERALAEDETVLDRLSVGRVALEHLPDVQELGMVPASQPLLKLAYRPDLDTYIASFETPEERSDKNA